MHSFEHICGAGESWVIDIAITITHRKPNDSEAFRI